jgi:hypothetical protein
MRTEDPYRPPYRPLVSMIVRSMDRPELRLALESIARQNHPAIEVSRPEPLKRPLAAALALERARRLVHVPGRTTHASARSDAASGLHRMRWSSTAADGCATQPASHRCLRRSILAAAAATGRKLKRLSD